MWGKRSSSSAAIGSANENRPRTRHLVPTLFRAGTATPRYRLAPLGRGSEELSGNLRGCDAERPRRNGDDLFHRDMVPDDVEQDGAGRCDAAPAPCSDATRFSLIIVSLQGREPSGGGADGGDLGLFPSSRSPLEIFTSSTMKEDEMEDDPPLKKGTPVEPPPAPLEKELTLQERLEALLFSLQESARHNAPISPAHLTELESIVALEHKHGD